MVFLDSTELQAAVDLAKWDRPVAAAQIGG